MCPWMLKWGCSRVWKNTQNVQKHMPWCFFSSNLGKKQQSEPAGYNQLFSYMCERGLKLWLNFLHKEWFRSISHTPKWCLMRIYFKVSWCCCRQHQGSHKLRMMEEKNIEERKSLWGQGEGEGQAVPHCWNPGSWEFIVHTTPAQYLFVKAHPSPHVWNFQGRKGAGAALDAALSLPAPGTSLCLQKEWKLGRRGARSSAQGGSWAGLSCSCSAPWESHQKGNTERAAFSSEPPAPTAGQEWDLHRDGQSAPQLWGLVTAISLKCPNSLWQVMVTPRRHQVQPFTGLKKRC